VYEGRRSADANGGGWRDGGRLRRRRASRRHHRRGWAKIDRYDGENVDQALLRLSGEMTISRQGAKAAKIRINALCSLCFPWRLCEFARESYRSISRVGGFSSGFSFARLNNSSNFFCST